MTSTKSLKEICKIQLSTGLRNKLQGWFLLNHHQSEAGLCLAWHERFIPNFWCFQLSQYVVSFLKPWPFTSVNISASIKTIKQMNKTKNKKKRGRKKPSHLWEKTWQKSSKADMYSGKTGQIHRKEMHHVLLITQKPILAQKMSPLKTVGHWKNMRGEYYRFLSSSCSSFGICLRQLLKIGLNGLLIWCRMAIHIVNNMYIL